MSMIRQFLSTYTVRVRKFHGKADIDFTDLKSDPDAGDIFSILDEFISTLEKNDAIDSDNQTTVGAKQVKREPAKRNIYGMLDSGPYGQEGELKNTKTLQSKPITKDDAATYPYYFNFHLPLMGTTGLFAIHSRGKYGCKTPFQNALNEFLKKKYPNIRISLRPIEADFKRNYKFFKIGMQVRKIRAVAFKKLRVQDALLKGKKSAEETVTVERIVHVGRSSTSLFDPSKLTNAASAAETAIKTFEHYVEMPKEADNIRYQVTVTVGGQEKTMMLDQTLDFHLSFDLTDDLNGYTRSVATLNKLHDVCGPYIEHAKSEIIS